MQKKIILVVILALISLSIASSLSINNVLVGDAGPGDEGVIRIDLENEGSSDVIDVSLMLNFPSNIIPLGSSEGFVDKIKEDDGEEFAFKFKVSNTAIPGNYAIPYEISYREGDLIKKQNGDIGLIVKAQPQIEISIESENPIIGQTGKIKMRLVNNGLADARFVSVSVKGEGVTLLSDKLDYIGSIDSDDFETASFDVVYNRKRPILDVELRYRDFDNVEQKNYLSIPLEVYTEDEAIAKGIKEKNNLPIYVGAILFAIVIWLIIRKISKRRKANRL